MSETRSEKRNISNDLSNASAKPMTASQLQELISTLRETPKQLPSENRSRQCRGRRNRTRFRTYTLSPKASRPGNETVTTASGFVWNGSCSDEDTP